MNGERKRLAQPKRTFCSKAVEEWIEEYVNMSENGTRVWQPNGDTALTAAVIARAPLSMLHPMGPSMVLLRPLNDGVDGAGPYTAEELEDLVFLSETYEQMKEGDIVTLRAVEVRSNCIKFEGAVVNADGNGMPTIH